MRVHTFILSTLVNEETKGRLYTLWNNIYLSISNCPTTHFAYFDLQLDHVQEFCANMCIEREKLHTVSTYPRLINMNSITFISCQMIIIEGSAVRKSSLDSKLTSQTNPKNNPYELQRRIKVIDLPRKEFNNADFPAFFSQKQSTWKHFCLIVVFYDLRLLLVTRTAEDGSPGYPMYIRFSTVRAGSKSAISAHCNANIYYKFGSTGHSILQCSQADHRHKSAQLHQPSSVLHSVYFYPPH